MNKPLATLLTTLLCAIGLCAQPSVCGREGDLLFVVPVESNSITTVTQGDDTIASDHVAILHFISGNNTLPCVIEAIGSGVCLTPLDTFLTRHSHDRIVQAQVQDLDVPTSIGHALRLVGHPYDWLYQSGDSAIYCSELVQLCFVRPDGQRIFSTIPMTFRDRDGSIPQHWIDLYTRHQRPVPEGEPGTNPQQLLHHPAVVRTSK